MNRRTALLLPLSAAFALASKSHAAVVSSGARHREPRASDKLPDVSLRNQEGKEFLFYSDLVADRPVVISFMYVNCEGTCPETTAKLAKVWAGLEAELGRELNILSITLDPERDSAEELARYAKENYPADHAARQSRWHFLTGKKADVESLRKALGFTDPDPKVDADRSQHAAILTFGNDARNRWASLPTGIPEDQIVKTIGRIARPRKQQQETK
jgi:protein SCO1